MDIDLELDNNWVESYKNAEINYNEFYNEKVTNIKIFYLYINTENTIVKIKQKTILLYNEGMIPKEQLITLLHICSIKKYKLFSIVKYNINLLPDEINDFINNTKINYNERFLISETYLKDIYFTDTISIFQDLNSLYIIFKESSNNGNKFTKKIKTNIKKHYTRHNKR